MIGTEASVAEPSSSIDHVAVDELLTRYLETVETLAAERKWFESLTTFRFAALHMIVSETEPTSGEIRPLASELTTVLDRIDPLRTFSIPMAGLAMATQETASTAKLALETTLADLDSLPKPLGRTDRSRAVPLLAFGTPRRVHFGAAAALASVHNAWNQRHRWMTTGRHYSFAAIAVLLGSDPESTAGDAESVHDILGDAGYWHEWDASILLSLHRGSPAESAERYISAVRGFTRNHRKPPPVARDDLAVVSLVDGDPEIAGKRLLAYNDALLAIRPRPSRQVAMALAAGLTLAEGSDVAGWQRPIVDGFALYGYAEALREEASD